MEGSSNKMLAGVNLSKPGMNLSNPGMNLMEQGKIPHTYVVYEDLIMMFRCQ